MSDTINTRRFKDFYEMLKAADEKTRAAMRPYWYSLPTRYGNERRARAWLKNRQRRDDRRATERLAREEIDEACLNLYP
jgi:hypothetical protein